MTSLDKKPLNLERDDQRGKPEVETEILGVKISQSEKRQREKPGTLNEILKSFPYKGKERTPHIQQGQREELYMDYRLEVERASQGSDRLKQVDYPKSICWGSYLCNLEVPCLFKNLCDVFLNPGAGVKLPRAIYYLI